MVNPHDGKHDAQVVTVEEEFSQEIFLQQGEWDLVGRVENWAGGEEQENDAN